MGKEAKRTILLAEAAVIVRLAIGDFLRACGHRVLEAASAEEAKAILQAGIEIHAVISDAELAGGESGFALAHWVRRYRPQIAVTLARTVSAKTQAANELCSQPPCDVAVLASRIRALTAERKRRARPISSPVTARQRRRRS